MLQVRRLTCRLQYYVGRVWILAFSVPFLQGECTFFLVLQTSKIARRVRSEFYDGQIKRRESIRKKSTECTLSSKCRPRKKRSLLMCCVLCITVPLFSHAHITIAIIHCKRIEEFSTVILNFLKVKVHISISNTLFQKAYSNSMEHKSR